MQGPFLTLTLMRRSPLLPRSPHSRHQPCSDFPSASPKTHEKALKSQMSTLICAQIHSLATSLPQSIPSNPRGISVHPAKISSSLGRHPRWSSLSRYPLTVIPRPVNHFTVFSFLKVCSSLVCNVGG